MKTQLTLIVAVSLLLSLTTLSAHAISAQQIEKKAREIAEFKKKQELLSIAQELGADTDSVTVKLERRGKILKLNGTVPGSNDLIRILLAVEAVGPFKTIRNYLKVTPPEAADGVVMRPVYFEFMPPPPDTVITEEEKHCAHLYKEYNKIMTTVKTYVLRPYDKRSNIYKPTAKKLIKRLSEIQDHLDASLCYRRVNTPPA